MYILNHHLIGAEVNYHWTKKNKEPLKELDTIVIHYTAGGNALSSAQYLSNPNTRVSAHLLVARNGDVYQMVDFATQAWHAGKSKLDERENVNEFSIGIELENPGFLKLKQEHYYTWFGKRVGQRQVEEHLHPISGEKSYWHSFRLQQIEKVKRICILLCQHYKIKHIVGHSEISLSGKLDPGPAFPLENLRNSINLRK